MKLLLVFLLFSCATLNRKPKARVSDVETLKERYEEKIKVAKEAFDQETGWPSRSDCDATLWAGLALAGGVDTVKIGLAEYAPGEIHRRPSPSCYYAGTDHGAKTTVSRDMLAGYMWGIWSTRDSGAALRLSNYGESRGWKMGEPVADGRVFLSPNGIGTLGRILKKIGAADKSYRHLPMVFTKVHGYEAHLMVLQILLNGQVMGAITSDQAELLDWLSEQDPQNATFQAASALYRSGNFEKAISLLIEDSYYPPYVSGHDNYKLVYWLFSAKIILQSK